MILISRTGPPDGSNYAAVLNDENQYSNGQYFECPLSSPCWDGGRPALDIILTFLGVALGGGV